MEQKNTLQPILRWAGGKRQLLPEILPLIPDYESYYEPFFGGGSVAFSLDHGRIVAGDLNPELVRVYRCVKECPEDLIASLRGHAMNDSKDYYYKVRAMDRDPGFYGLLDVERAARMLYLNKTCFNGIWRVNAKGQNNVPYGNRGGIDIVNEDGILKMHAFMRDRSFLMREGGYEYTLKDVTCRDFVYLDPPYMPISDSSSFEAYTKDGFGVKGQVRLKEYCDELDRKGVRFLLSNSCCDFILDLYRDYDVRIVAAKRCVNAKGNGRGTVNEVLVKNY